VSVTAADFAGDGTPSAFHGAAERELARTLHLLLDQRGMKNFMKRILN